MYNALLKYVILPVCSQHTGIADCLIKIRKRRSKSKRKTGPLGTGGTVRKLLPEQNGVRKSSARSLKNTKQVYPVFSAVSRIRLQ